MAQVSIDLAGFGPLLLAKVVVLGDKLRLSAGFPIKWDSISEASKIGKILSMNPSHSTSLKVTLTLKTGDLLGV